MRASITKVLNARHDPFCHFTIDEMSGDIIYICHPTCAIAALEDGDINKGVAKWVTAFWMVEQKIAKRKRRRARKRRRGWA